MRPNPIEQEYPELEEPLAQICAGKHETIKSLYLMDDKVYFVPKIKKVETVAKVGRNDPCPCGRFGKKYKQCCGRT